MINFENLSHDNRVKIEMLAHYGFTISLAQKFEKAIACLLQGEFASENKGTLPYEDYLEEVERLYKGNLGGLLKKLKSRTNVPVEKTELLQKALNRRNYLIHDYFYHNESKETITDGRLSMIQELISDQFMFSEIIHWINDLCQEGLLRIGITSEKFATIVEDLRQHEISKFQKSEPIDLLTK